MPSSGKRAQRVKRENPSGADVETPTTSPTRSSKRRRTKEIPPQPVVEPVKLPTSQAELDMSEEELVSTVSQHLLLPEHFVQVARDHNNDLHQRQSTNVAAYAKITGRNWTFYVKRLRTSIGRPPEGFVPGPQDDAPSTPAASNEGFEVPAAPTESSRIHVDLGPNKLVSRLHAEIFFDSNTERWNLIVNGRNGVKIDDQPLRRGQSSRLSSGHVIEIGGVEMMFVLPENDAPVQIHEKYLQRANLIQPEFPEDTTADPRSLSQMMNGSLGERGQNGPSGVPIAPAPPDYRRPDTPVKHRSRAPHSTNSPYNTAGGTMMMSSDNIIDYNLDHNAHVKPQFTYSQLISQAIMATTNEEETLNGIYEYCEKNYAFYRRKETQKGWQNSIRHNLSLNHGFVLRPRESHEPGKGGYWRFTSKFRDNLMADAWGSKDVDGKKRRSPGGSPPGSTTPLSPGMTSRTMHGPGDKNGGSPTRKPKLSPKSHSPTLSSYPSNAPNFTPDRRNQGPAHDGLPGDGSPLPRHRRPAANVFGLSDNMTGSPPVLSSSFAPDDSNSLITPAPVRKHPYLAPPSTAQRPSQHMPTSSPAPFWRYADFGNTPMRGSGFDLSPTKDSGAGQMIPQSSSPPPRKDSAGSPSRRAPEVKTEGTDVEEPQGEEPAFDLTRGFMSISRYHASTNNGAPLASAANS